MKFGNRVDRVTDWIPGMSVCVCESVETFYKRDIWWGMIDQSS